MSEGVITNLVVDYEISIKNLFILYLRKINKQDIIRVNNINNIISFIYDFKKINLGDETPVYIYFKGLNNPIIYVKFTGSEDFRKSRNVKFKTTSGQVMYIDLLENSTIKQVLDEYLEEVNKKELIDDNSNKICFLYNGNKIKFEDMNFKVFEFFKNDFNPIIVVNDPNNLIGSLNKK